MEPHPVLARSAWPATSKSRPASCTPACSPSATCSTTSPCGDGPNGPNVASCSPPTFPACPARSHAASPPTSTAPCSTRSARLDDVFARVGITLLRRAGLRLGELLDLELNCVVDYGPTGTWLRVPLGKLGTERSVPLDADTIAVLDTDPDRIVVQ